MKRIARKSVAVMLMLIMLLGAMSTATFAAAKSKTVKKLKFSTSTEVIKKKATTVKKGTTKLTITKGVGYIRFVAPSTKKYSFTFSDFKSKKGNNAYVSVQMPDKTYPKYCYHKIIKTKGGKSSALWVSINGTKFDFIKKVVDRPIAKRTGTIKLKKGQAIYFYFSNVFDSKTTAKLVIK